MKGVVAAAAIVAVIASGCGNTSDRGRTDNGAPAGKATDGPATSVTANGVYEVGVDIPSGIYTAKSLGCLGFAASTADFNLENDTDPDAFLRGADRVGDATRIVVHDGEFFTSMECDGWQRESAAEPTSPDPATLAGGCEILLGGEDLVQQVVAYLRKPTKDHGSALASDFQDRLMAPVAAGNRLLGDAAGQLVDALDDPSAYVTAGGDPTGDVARAIAKIRSACA